MKKFIAIACMASVLFASCDKIGTDNGKDEGTQEKPRFEKADINDFEIIKIKGYKFTDAYDSKVEYEITFDILDRNLGAAAAYDETATPEANKAAVGDYYQFRNSAAVGTVDGLNEGFDPANDGKTDDWTKEESNPCPEGWRIPNAQELEFLEKAMEIGINDDYYDIHADQSDEDIAKAEAFEKKLKLAPCGYWKVKPVKVEEKAAESEPVETTELYLPEAKYFWGADFSFKKDGQPITTNDNVQCAYSFEYNSFGTASKFAPINSARPIRCIK